MKTLVAILRMRCPRCRQGPIYERGQAMLTQCPHCALRYQREDGYFLGALYFSYAFASVFLGLCMLALVLIWPDLDLGVAVLIAAGLFLPFVPAFTRYARVVWIYFDRWLWPDMPGPMK